MTDELYKNQKATRKKLHALIEEKLPSLVTEILSIMEKEIVRRDTKLYPHIKTQKQCRDKYSFETWREIEGAVHLNDFISYPIYQELIRQIIRQLKKQRR